MKKVLVTGANGFIGSHICETLLDSGYAVRVLVRKTSDLSNLKDLDIETAYGDLTDYDSLRPAVKDVDCVVNNGGLTKTLNKREFEEVNATGTENILKAVLNSNGEIIRFIQVSSAAACGPSGSMEPIKEDTVPKPLSAYGRSKLGGEKAVLEYKDRFPVTILRPSAVYGPRDKEMLSFFKAVKFGMKPTFGMGECYVNFTFVKDLADAVGHVLEKDNKTGEVYFVAEKRTYSYSEAGDIISEMMGQKALDIHIPTAILRAAGKITEIIASKRNRPAIFTKEKAVELYQKYWVIDSSRIEKELGFRAETSFGKGAAETIKWYKESGWL